MEKQHIKPTANVLVITLHGVRYRLSFPLDRMGCRTIQLWDEQGPYETATLTGPGVSLPPNEVIVKPALENGVAIFEVLCNAGVVSYTGMVVRVGTTNGYLCRLSKQALRYIKRVETKEQDQ